MSATELAERAMKTLLEHEGKYIDKHVKPMGVFVIRFSGTNLAHVGKAADAAIDRLLAAAPAPLTYRGIIQTAGKLKYYQAPKPTTGGGRTTLTKALGAFKKFPKERTRIYFKDGTPDQVLPDRFSVYMGLAANDGRGFLSCAVPLDTLEDAKWLALVDELVILLAAEVAWMGPALWFAPRPMFPGALNKVDKPAALIELFARDPQIDLPIWLASDGHPFEHDHFEPGPFDGFLAPAWVMWANPVLAKRVKAYSGATAKLHGGAARYHIGQSPFEMTEATYAAWKARWAELAPLHVRYTDENVVSTYYCGRFAAASLEALPGPWRGANDAEAARANRERAITGELSKLAADPGTKLLEYADSVAKEMTYSNAWYFLPALRQLLEAEMAKPAEALVWLDICEQMNAPQLFRKMAAVATASGDITRAIDLLRRGFAAHHIHSKPELRRDPEFKALRKDPRFKKLVG